MPIIRKINNNILTDDQQTIVALCTPRGNGAIALIRLSGTNVFEIVDQLAKLSIDQKGHNKTKSSVSTQSSHTIHYGHIVDRLSESETIIDKVLFLVMRGPKTFTGQDTVEITCHNNQFVIEKIIQLAIHHGARQAQPGEFTKRAFLNGKMDLVQAESINELINAQTECALKKSMSQLHGSLSHHLKNLEKQIITLLSHVEASFEFLDEEQRDLNLNKKIKDHIDELLDHIKELISNFSQQQQIKEGIRIAILGTVNAGKSTLFNTLVKKERAIVSDIEGTTRDSIETNIYQNGIFWLLIDTAGLRQSKNIIEQKGIDRSFTEAALADIILLVLDITCPLSKQQESLYKELVNKYKDKIIVVANKVDNKESMNQFSYPKILNQIPLLKVSAQKKIGLQELKVAIKEKIQQLFSNLNSPFLLNQRQFNLLVEIEQIVKLIKNKHQKKLEHELIAYHLKEILEKLSQLTGQNVTQQVIDTVFDEFCIGK